MPAPVWSDRWTLRRLIQNTWTHRETRTRFDNRERDVLRGITVESRRVHEGASASKTWAVFKVTSSSYPQYAPYIERARRASGHRQRRYKHHYQVTLSLPRLSIDAPVRIRTGADRRWDFSPAARPRVIGSGRTRQVIESRNVERGINGDFFFRLENLYAREGILFGRDWTSGPARRTNPRNIVFLDKHALRVVEILMTRGILGAG